MYLHKQLNRLTTARNVLFELYVYLHHLNAALEPVAKCLYAYVSMKSYSFLVSNPLTPIGWTYYRLSLFEFC